MIKFYKQEIKIFHSRSKRFFVNFNDDSVGYCPNPGKMADILIPGSPCLVVPYEGKLKWRWEAVNINGQWIGVNTQNPNKLAEEILNEFGRDFRREVSFGHYRADFANEDTIIEVKNVHWSPEENFALFPDCVTKRGARQMYDLSELSKEYKCYVIYIVQRSDITHVTTADYIDLEYHKAAIFAKKSGVKFLGFNCKVEKSGISILKKIKVI